MDNQENAKDLVQEEVKQETPVADEVKEVTVEKVEAPVTSQAPKVENRGTVKETQVKSVSKPQVVQQPKAIVKDTTAQLPGEFDSMVQKLRSIGTPAEVQLVTALESYVEAMKPGRPIDPTPGVNQQYKLWIALRRVIEDSATQEFNKLWGIVVAYFRQHQKGVFNGQYVNRFAEYWTRTDDELFAFQQLTNLLGIVVTDRQNLTKIVSIHKVVEKNFSEVGRGRLIQMYGN